MTTSHAQLSEKGCQHEEEDSKNKIKRVHHRQKGQDN